MPFKHLFIFPNHRFVESFLRDLEDRTRYTHRPIGGYRRLSMMNADGEHEIIIGVVNDIRGDRYRGMNFDKVSIHEAVELTWEIHNFIQQRMYRRFMGMKMALDPNLRSDQMYFFNEGPWAEEMRRREDDRADALRYLLGSFPINVPEYKGIVGDLSI